MPKAKSALPESTKLNYTLMDGVPAIEIVATLTTPDQVQALIEQLDKLATVLPAAKARNRPKKVRVTRANSNNTIAERKEVQ